MYNIDSAGNVDGEWSNGTPPATPGTDLDATWMNMLQSELQNILSAADIAPVKGTNNQVVTAIQALIAAGQNVNAYKRDYAAVNNYASLAAFLAGTYVSMGVCRSSAGELAESRSDASASATMLYSMVVQVTTACTPEIIVTLADDAVLLYLDGTLENTWTGPSNYGVGNEYALSLSVGTHVIQFLNTNSSGGAASCFVNDWMTAVAADVTWLRAARS